MASFSTLSTTDAALFKSLQASALLPALAEPGKGELVELFKANKRQEELKKVEPYADLLEIVLKQQLTDRADSIMKQLRETKGATFTVDLFSWKTVHYYESLTGLQERVAAMSPDEKAEHQTKMVQRDRQIKDNGWESMFSVEGQSPYSWDCDDVFTYYTYYPMKVDRIFRNSDLSCRLSLALGPSFFPSYRWERVEDAGDEGDSGFCVYKKTLYVRYYPFGVQKPQLEKLLTVAKRQAERMSLGEKTGFAASEYAVGHTGLCVLPEPSDEDRGGRFFPFLSSDAEEDYSDMPPLVAAPAARPKKVSTWGREEGRCYWGRAEEDRCFCGCDDEESE